MQDERQNSLVGQSTPVDSLGQCHGESACESFPAEA